MFLAEAANWGWEGGGSPEWTAPGSCGWVPGGLCRRQGCEGTEPGILTLSVGLEGNPRTPIPPPLAPPHPAPPLRSKGPRTP